MFKNLFTKRTNAQQSAAAEHHKDESGLIFLTQTRSEQNVPLPGLRIKSNLSDTLGDRRMQPRSSKQTGTNMSRYWVQGYYDASPKNSTQQQLNILYAPQVGPIE